MDLKVAYEALKISSGTSFVRETESQLILNDSRDVSFTMNLVAKDIVLISRGCRPGLDTARVEPIFNLSSLRMGLNALEPVNYLQTLLSV